MRRDAVKTFLSCRLESGDFRYNFFGHAATVIRAEEGFNPRRDPSMFSMTIYAHNEAGEYFMFITNDPKPYIKHLSRERVRQVLGPDWETPSIPKALEALLQSCTDYERRTN